MLMTLENYYLWKWNQDWSLSTAFHVTMHTTIPTDDKLFYATHENRQMTISWNKLRSWNKWWPSTFFMQRTPANVFVKSAEHVSGCRLHIMHWPFIYICPKYIYLKIFKYTIQTNINIWYYWYLCFNEYFQIWQLN